MDPNNIIVRLCNNENHEINSIKSLQNENLKGNLPGNDAVQEGFVTAVYDLEFLRFMNDIEPSIVAIDQGIETSNVIGMLSFHIIVSLFYSYNLSRIPISYLI